jgi:hypothetical protein
MSAQLGEGVYVYGVVPAGASFDLRERRPEEQVRLIEVEQLAAIVGEALADDDEAARERALAHARVLRAAVEATPVVPMRFGIVFPDEESVRSELLEERHDALVRLLKKVEHLVQMTLKVYYDEDGLFAEIVETEPEIARLRDVTSGGDETETYNARVQLGELVTVAIERRQQQDAAEIVKRLNPRAFSSLMEPLEKELMVLNAPFLIERKLVGEFENAVEEIAEERAGVMNFKLLGPQPAYHFIDLQEPTWA